MNATQDRKPIWRKVIDQHTHMNPGASKSRFTGGSRCFHLECDHRTYRKLSQGAPSRIRCRDCESLRSGATSTVTHLDGTQTTETWNAATQSPQRTTSHAKAAAATAGSVHDDENQTPLPAERRGDCHVGERRCRAVAHGALERQVGERRCLGNVVLAVPPGLRDDNGVTDAGRAAVARQRDRSKVLR